jgi:HipA-like kinase
MRGGAQGKLVSASDNNLYVVKFRNNPQHRRILINELFATKLAGRLGLPIATPQPVEVCQSCIRSDSRFRIELPQGSRPCEAGLQFGSRYVVDPLRGRVFDIVPATLLGRVENPDAFIGALVFDKWTSNSDYRQVLVWKNFQDSAYRLCLIDHGACFGGGNWTFSDEPVLGLFSATNVYRQVRGWKSFDPWLTQIEELGESDIWNCAQGIPAEWFTDEDDFARLATKLFERRKRVRRLINALRHTVFNPFQNWRRSRSFRGLWGRARPQHTIPLIS